LTNAEEHRDDQQRERQPEPPPVFRLLTWGITCFGSTGGVSPDIKRSSSKNQPAFNRLSPQPASLLASKQ